MKNGFITASEVLIPIRVSDLSETHDKVLSSLGTTWNRIMHKDGWIKVRQGTFMYSINNQDAKRLIKNFLINYGNQSEYGDKIYLIEVDKYGFPSYKSFSYAEFTKLGELPNASIEI